ncbi:Monoterpene epsilon-lactone hydrolase [Zhongshania aliphaticivorans]|uniref:Monoterpene epsilon-lactone hydrolase n=1 Tax=Zhongshania aliphaticivorans TaxID=1470434 RepID=A0A5S9NM62_9GAMM|nr:alpha/beta hydrolase [Zhongshania aliphaticivorans]CAA0091164.1 Monoterpene epsilon-lactone hydrolase [Zhongshania aliphaticivorans]CAA0098630.1 Monoterpene epsilon-lactone hydrolase [Zhongshania aliphaticivorans]
MKQSIRSRLFNLLLRLIRRPISNMRQLTALRLRFAKIDKRAEGKAERLCRIKQIAQTHCQVDVLQPLDFAEEECSAKHVLFFHGGAYCLRSPNSHREMLSAVCTNLSAIGVLPDYRLAPEDPHPAAIDDCFESYQALLDRGVSADRIALLGDSAGGGLLLSILVKIRLAGLAMPSSASLLSPAGDWTLSVPSLYENEGRDPMFRLSSFLFFRSLYLAGYDANDPVVSPLLASFDGYPPMYFSASSTELLRDVAVLGAQKAREAGVPVEIDLWPGHCHDIQLMAMLPDSKIARNKLCEFIAKHW